MKHLILALAIALLSTPAATTAWSQQTEQTGPTEQETKGFIAKAMSRCDAVEGAQFRGETLHLRYNQYHGSAGFYISPQHKTQTNVPVHELDIVNSGNKIYSAQSLGSNINSKYRDKEYLQFTCKGIKGGCIRRTLDGKKANKFGKFFFFRCPNATNSALEKAFNHLIGIYKARSPKPLFE